MPRPRELLEPWPLKIVLDNLLQAGRCPGGWRRWSAGSAAIGWRSSTSPCVAVAVIAVAAPLSSYLQNYLTTNVGQWVMHDLRRTLYHHIHRLSLAEHDEKRTGDLIGRVTSDIEAIQDFVTSALLGIADQRPHAGRHRRRDALPELALHAHLALDRAGAVSGRLFLHAADQESLARRPEEGKRAGLDRRRRSSRRFAWSRPSPARTTRSGGSSARASTTSRPRWRAQHQDDARAGRRDHRRDRNLPDALVRRAAGARRPVDRRCAGRLPALPRARCTSRCATCRR